MKLNRILKSSFLMKITELEEVQNEEGKKEFKVVNSHWEKMRGKDFEQSLYEDRANMKERITTVVAAEPENFQFNNIYIHALGKKAWVYVLRGE